MVSNGTAEDTRTRPSLSVAMCTCEGARFLPEQLASIAAQSRLPDEMVVRDDASTDDTVGILRAFAARAAFPVRIEVNAGRLGVVPNFERAIRDCSGDMIALADQDDVWMPAKLARAEEVLARHPDAGLVFSDAEVVDDTLAPLGHSLWQFAGFTEGEQAMMNSGGGVAVLLRHQVVTGATLTFRRALFPLLFPIDRGWVHDGWMALLAAATGAVVPIAERLMLYRQHASNQIGGRRRGLVELLRNARSPGQGNGLDPGRSRFAAVRRRLEERGVMRPDVRQLLDDVDLHLGLRAGLSPLRGRRFLPVMREALSGRYQRYSRGWQSVLQDLLR